jgi:hypothetical protein
MDSIRKPDPNKKEKQKAPRIYRAYLYRILIVDKYNKNENYGGSLEVSIEIFTLKLHR